MKKKTQEKALRLCTARDEHSMMGASVVLLLPKIIEKLKETGYGHSIVVDFDRGISVLNPYGYVATITVKERPSNDCARHP